MKLLLIAEKPSMMRAIRDVYQAMTHPDQIDFRAFHGHLMGLKTPEEYNKDWGGTWNASQLPMLPIFTYKATDSAGADALKKTINAGNYDYIVNACDAGREGEHIFWSFYETYGFTTPVLRYWANSNAQTAVENALNNLMPASNFDGMREASKLRARLDWLVGMNFSRAASLSTGGNVTVGRVQSPTLKLIVDRELAIERFISKDYFQVQGEFKTPKGDVFTATNYKGEDAKDTRYESQAEADSVKSTLSKDCIVKALKSEEKSTSAPTLFSLAELQKSANNKFKMTPDDTLATAQTLYEAGYITYPRTESRYLPTEMVTDLPKYIKSLESIPDLSALASKITQADITRATTGNQYVDDKRIEDHHAIIPTDVVVPYAKLSKKEQDVYLLIAKQFLAIFYPARRVSKTVVTIESNGNMFIAEGNMELDPGYTEVWGGEKKEVLLPPMNESDPLNLTKLNLVPGKTKPPQRYSPATLLSAMQNAGKDIPDAKQRSILKESAGLGTSATRAQILDSLIKKSYVSLEKNFYIPSKMAKDIIAVLGSYDFCSPSLTAIWEEKLQGLEKNTYTGNVDQEIIDYICEEVVKLSGITTSLASSNGNGKSFPIVGVCPICGKDVQKKKSFYTCQQYKADSDPCNFLVPMEKYGAKITDTDMKALLKGGNTKEKTVTFTTGKKGKKQFLLNKNGYLAFV